MQLIPQSCLVKEIQRVINENKSDRSKNLPSVITDSQQPAAWSIIMEDPLLAAGLGACQEPCMHNLGGLCIFYLNHQVKIWRKTASLWVGAAIYRSRSQTYQANMNFQGGEKSEVWNWAAICVLSATIYFTIIIDVNRNIYRAQISHYHLALCYIQKLWKKIFFAVIHKRSAILIIITR